MTTSTSTGCGSSRSVQIQGMCGMGGADEGLSLLEICAAAVPRDGIVLDLGAGDAAVALTLAAFCHPDATIFCWHRFQEAGGQEALEAMRQRVVGAANVIVGGIPDAAFIEDWNVPVDLASIVTGPDVGSLDARLDFLRSWLTAGGSLCGTLLPAEHADLLPALRRFAEDRGGELTVQDRAWRMRFVAAGRHAASDVPPAPAPLAIDLGHRHRALLDRASPIAMIYPEEMTLLFRLAKDHYRGIGEIVELGSWLGASAMSLGMGLSENRVVQDKAERIWSFDRFLRFGHRGHHPVRDIELELALGSFLPSFEENTAPWAAHIRTVPGDLLHTGWPDKPIEIGFNDLGKSLRLMTHIVGQFMARLVPEQAVWIEQDYYYWRCAWSPITMELLGPWFRKDIDAPGSSACFRPIRAIPRCLLSLDLDGALAGPARRRLLARAAARALGLRALCLELGALALLDKETSTAGLRDTLAFIGERADAFRQDPWRASFDPYFQDAEGFVAAMDADPDRVLGAAELDDALRVMLSMKFQKVRPACISADEARILRDAAAVIRRLETR